MRIDPKALARAKDSYTILNVRRTVPLRSA
jgi:hypothetical protein